VTGEVLNCRQMTQRGLSAVDRGEWDQAEQAFSQAVKSCPADSEARRHYAEALWHRGAHQEAVVQLREAIRYASDEPLLTVRLGEMLLEDGNFDSAYDCAQQALDVDPKLARAWLLRAQTLARRGEPRQALADYHRALRCDPDNREALLKTAELHRQLNQPERALTVLQSLADTYRLGEEPQQVSFLSGLAYSALARHDDAIESFQRALRHAPTPEILCHLADAELQAGRPTQAREAATAALALDPGHQPSQALLNRLATAPSDTRWQR
jgi:tetratricopeptide (TPR) repeat protein